MSHDRQPLHTAGTRSSTLGGAISTGPETVATWAAPTARLDVASGPCRSASTRSALARAANAVLRRPILVGATTALAVAGLTAALLLSGSAARAESGVAAIEPSAPAASPVVALPSERCVGEARTLTGRIVTARHGGVSIPVAVVDRQTTAICHPTGAEGPAAATSVSGGAR